LLFFDFYGLAAAFHPAGAAFGHDELGTAFGAAISLSNFVCHSVPPCILENRYHLVMSLTLVLIIEIILLPVKADRFHQSELAKHITPRHCELNPESKRRILIP
jgi:hypothetical protein